MDWVWGLQETESCPRGQGFGGFGFGVVLGLRAGALTWEIGAWRFGVAVRGSGSRF